MSVLMPDSLIVPNMLTINARLDAVMQSVGISAFPMCTGYGTMDGVVVRYEGA
ncbi:MAG: hypothetical protein HN337_03385 [Deltaproteobacteria bacterium]|nr:hypothetical protein [Deltaproteobacteria bacterium]